MPIQLTTKQVAERAGITVGSVRQYRYRGRFPEPDGFVGRTPWWKPATVRQWLKTRRGPGRPPKNGGE